MTTTYSFSRSLWNVFTGTPQQSVLSPVGQLIEDGKYKKALVLIQSGTAVQIIERDGSSNLRKVVSIWLDQKMNIDLIKMLLSFADIKTINYCEDLFSPALNQASYAGSVEVVDLLVASRADVNAGNRYQTTPLMHAALVHRYFKKRKQIQMFFKRQLDTARALVRHGALVNLINYQKRTALQIHVEETVRPGYHNINQKLISFLVEHWANPLGIVVAPSRYGPSTEILEKIKTAVQEGLALRDTRKNGIACALGIHHRWMVSLVLEYEP